MESRGGGLMEGGAKSCRAARARVDERITTVQDLSWGPCLKRGRCHATSQSRLKLDDIGLADALTNESIECLRSILNISGPKFVIRPARSAARKQPVYNTSRRYYEILTPKC